MNTFYHGDCKFVMNHDIEPNSIDLIYLDPPFFTGKTQKGTAKWQPEAMEVSYEDSKRFWGDTEKVNAMRTRAPEWLRHIAQTRPDFASYLFYMMERLEACHKVLKDTGSIYLHCDEKASHYLKMIMDEVFGFEHYQNEVIWHYISAPEAKTRYGKKHDTILYYVKSDTFTFNLDDIRVPHSNNTSPTRIYKHKVKDSITAEMIVKEYVCHTNPLGKALDDVWGMPLIAAVSKERVGYPTQKPLALLERIIKASSNEGDLVLDPFCGCGTAIIAAQRLNRRWIGIDISKDAYEISSKRHGELPLEFTHFEYVSRDLDEVLAIDKPAEFEKWVNRFFKAYKPSPDKGVDGIMPDGTPIQTKTFLVGYTWLSEYISNIKFHPLVKKPCRYAKFVSQKGFDDGARQRQDEIKNDKEPVEIELLRPTDMLKVGKL